MTASYIWGKVIRLKYAMLPKRDLNLEILT